MLSMIDENDLAEFIGDTKEDPKQEQPSVIIPETEKPSVPEEPEMETEPEEKGRRHEYGRPACGDCAFGWRHRRILLF